MRRDSCLPTALLALSAALPSIGLSSVGRPRGLVETGVHRASRIMEKSMCVMYDT